MIGEDLFEEELKEETRRGFTISELMKRSWAVDLDIMAELYEICVKHEIKVFACYGTLLGAVREQGFIPWDDDIDIGMIGDDYVRFLDILASEYSDRFNILNPYTRTWYNMNFSHITNAKETSFERSYLEKWHGCPFMTGPDVYPYYYIPRNPQEEQFILDVLERIDTILAMNKCIQSVVSDNQSINEEIAIALVELQHITGYEFTNDRPLDNQLEILYDQVCRITEEDDADYVARYDEYSKDRSKKFPKDYFETIICVPFENIKMPVPIGYDAILSARFGDMYIIPKKEAAAHGYPYYSKQLDEGEYRKICMKQKVLVMSDSIDTSEEALSHKTKKRILYHTGFKAVLTNCDSVITKIKRVLAYAEDLKDNYELWWMPDELIKTDEIALDLVVPGLIAKYEKVISDYKIYGGHLCSMRMSELTLLKYFDEYYGDEGELSDAFYRAGKTVTIQDYKSEQTELNIHHIEDSYNKSVKEGGRVDRYIPDKWKSILFTLDGGRKKTVLYVNSISVMYQNQDIYLNKLKRVLDLFRKNSNDIALMWKPAMIHADIRRAFSKDFLQEYEELIRKSGYDSCMVLDENDDIDIAVEVADAYYGDPNDILLNCNDKGLPIMIQRCEVV